MEKEQKINDKWLVIVNPNAGRKKGKKDWEKISKLLIQEGILFKRVFTKEINHAIHLSIKYIEQGFIKIIVVGGDGTLNEVVNGIFTQNFHPPLEITLGMIPVGTGNDWCRMYGIPLKYKKAVQIIANEKSFSQDIGKVEYFNSNKKETRYFANVAGLGYDAFVAKKTNRLKEKGGGNSFAYLLNIVLGLFQYKTKFIELKIDNKLKFKGRIFSMSVGICRFNGGGMMQLPNAIPNDGIFDLTIIKKTTKMKVVKNIKNLYDGSFIKMPEVLTFTGKSISIISKPIKNVFLETDGESLGHSPINFEILPRSLNVIVNKIPE